MEIITYIMTHYMEILGAGVGLLGSLVVILALIPGEQPGESKLKSLYAAGKKLIKK